MTPSAPDPHRPSDCACTGPARVVPGSPADYTMEATAFAVGAGAYLGGKGARAITGLDTVCVQDLGQDLMGGAMLLAGLQVLGELGEVLTAHEGIHPYDVRNDSPERRAAMREGLEGIRAAVEVPRLPVDEADRVALQERLVHAMQGVVGPDDPCGWYRFGWHTHNALLERVLENGGLAVALALAASDRDGPQCMRLARIPQAEVGCNRFWFGFRDANLAMARHCSPLA